jgi:hypothetical protein
LIANSFFNNAGLRNSATSLLASVPNPKLSIPSIQSLEMDTVQMRQTRKTHANNKRKPRVHILNRHIPLITYNQTPPTNDAYLSSLRSHSAKPVRCTARHPRHTCPAQSPSSCPCQKSVKTNRAPPARPVDPNHKGHYTKVQYTI